MILKGVKYEAKLARCVGARATENDRSWLVETAGVGLICALPELQIILRSDTGASSDDG